MSLKTKIYSIGASDEDHSPALPNNTDDVWAKRISLVTSEKLGADYRGHLPFSGDGVGDIAKAWNHNYVPQEELVEGVKNWIINDIQLNKGERFNHISIISGHGGNNFLKGKLEDISNSLGVPIFYFPPLVGLETEHPDFGRIIPGHANPCEHSLGLYLNQFTNGQSFNQRAFDEMAKAVWDDPIKFLKEHPSVELAGYCLPELDPEGKFANLQTDHRVERAKKFVKRKEVFANYDVGKHFYDGEIQNAIEQIDAFVKKN